jgi:hypothetical protein
MLFHIFAALCNGTSYGASLWHIAVLSFAVLSSDKLSLELDIGFAGDGGADMQRELPSAKDNETTCGDIVPSRV